MKIHGNIAINQSRQVINLLEGDYQGYTKNNPLMVTQIEKYTNWYCSLEAGKEYEFRINTNIDYSVRFGVGVQAYLLKDKKAETRIGLLVKRQTRTDSVPETTVDVAQNNTQVVVVFKCQVSGDYYLRLDNFEYATQEALFWDIVISEKNAYVVPITDSAERNAQVQGEDYLKLSWSDNRCEVIPALSYIDYYNERFYLQSNYLPTKKADDLFTYSVKFVKVHCLFSEAIFLRSVNVEGVTWQEPQFDINANKQLMTDMVVESINNLPFIKKLGITFLKPYNDAYDDKYKEYSNTKLQAFSFDCTKVSEVLNNIAETYETEWWVEDTEDVSVKVLHFDKCATNDFTLELSDKYVEDENHNYTSFGLKSVEPDSSNTIPERVYIYGSDRNITKKTVQQQVEGGVMNVSYAKRLRLGNKKVTTTKSGVAIEVNTNDSSISIKNISNGRMDSYINEEIYPKMTMTISEVREERNSEDVPFYYIKSKNLTSDFMDSEVAESYPDSLNPSRQGLLIEGTTLMVTFTSGMLNGMEFECAWYQSRAEIGIIPDESDDQQIPYGNIKPKAGDTFVLWNLMMPQSAIDKAQYELLEDALEYIDSVVETVNGCKCKTDAQYFYDNNLTQGIKLGRRIKIDSEVFANTIFNNSSLTSRVKSFSYKLTKPYDITFNLHEARTDGILSSFENTITDIKVDAKQTTQLARSVSRRQWYDIDELSKMIESIKTQMLVVGEQHDNFTITSEIVYNNITKALSVSMGVLQHADYIDYGKNGAWEVKAFERYFEDYADTPYYIYAKCSKSNFTATIDIREELKEDSSSNYYFLIGILSSEYEGARVFNRTSGLSTIAGGTITTEQIQDYNRNLIIDFSSNPPRIIARNGAVIEGAIKFTSLIDEANNDVQGVISDASKNANTAVEIAQQVQGDINILDNNTKPLYEALKGSTEVIGGLVNTNVLTVNNNIKSVGGISGLDDNIAFWSGGTYQDAISGKCNIIIRKDGTAKIGVFKIENNQASIDLGNGNYATMSPNGIEVSLENQGKAKFDTTGVAIYDNGDKEKIKLVNKEIDFSLFRKTIENKYTKIDDITIPIDGAHQNTMATFKAGGSDIAFAVNNEENLVHFYNNLGSGYLRFRKTYDNMVNNVEEYYNINLMLNNLNDSSRNVQLKQFAVQVLTVSSQVRYYVVPDKIVQEVEDWGDYYIDTGSGVALNVDTLGGIKKFSNGHYQYNISINALSIGYRSGTYIIKNLGNVEYKIEEYTPRTLIGINGMMNFQTSYKYFGAYLDDYNKYNIIGEADKVTFNGKTI